MYFCLMSLIVPIVQHQYRQFSVGNLDTGHWTQTLVDILEILMDTNYEYQISFLIALTVFEIYLAKDGQTEQIYCALFQIKVKKIGYQIIICLLYSQTSVFSHSWDWDYSNVIHGMWIRCENRQSQIFFVQTYEAILHFIEIIKN